MTIVIMIFATRARAKTNLPIGNLLELDQLPQRGGDFGACRGRRLSPTLGADARRTARHCPTLGADGRRGGDGGRAHRIIASGGTHSTRARGDAF